MYLGWWELTAVQMFMPMGQYLGGHNYVLGWLLGWLLEWLLGWLWLSILIEIWIIALLAQVWCGCGHPYIDLGVVWVWSPLYIDPLSMGVVWVCLY